jgi:hypothetical protein
MTTKVAFRTLLRTPDAVLEQLEQGDVLLTRRGAEPLRLSKAHAVHADSDALSALAQLITLTIDDKTCERLANRLTDPFPWIALLPSKSQKEFVAELVDTARACASLGRFDEVTIALNAWKAKAEANPCIPSKPADPAPLSRAARRQSPSSRSRHAEALAEVRAALGMTNHRP